MSLTSAIFMPGWAERLKDMMPEIDADNKLTTSELIEIAVYTVQKINNYPKSFGKTVDNYFHLLFPDEIKAYLIRRGINAVSLAEMNQCCHQNLDEPKADASKTYPDKERADYAQE